MTLDGAQGEARMTLGGQPQRRFFVGAKGIKELCSRAGHIMGIRADSTGHATRRQALPTALKAKKKNQKLPYTRTSTERRPASNCSRLAINCRQSTATRRRLKVNRRRLAESSGRP